MCNIKIARERAGITQESLAKLLGVTQGAVAHWENGYSAPTASKIPAIAAALGCTVNDLFAEGDSDEKD